MVTNALADVLNFTPAASTTVIQLKTEAKAMKKRGLQLFLLTGLRINFTQSFQKAIQKVSEEKPRFPCYAMR
jgi:hypothetical protein